METTMKLFFLRILLFCSLVTVAGSLCQAQMNHYSPGLEGIKGASLPPPGLWIRDYNYIYSANHMKGSNAPPAFDVFANVQAPRLVWITNQKVLGGRYGMDVIAPFVYQDLTMTGFKGHERRMGDIFVEPINMSWNLQERFDLSFGYGLWLPTGHFNKIDPISPGKGFLTYMFTGNDRVYRSGKNLVLFGPQPIRNQQRTGPNQVHSGSLLHDRIRLGKEHKEKIRSWISRLRSSPDYPRFRHIEG